MKLKPIEALVLISLKPIKYLHIKTQKRTPRDDCVINIPQKKNTIYCCS